MDDTPPRIGVIDQKNASAQIFQITISLRDDWLHRGDALQDMDLQTYVETIEREATLIHGADMRKTLGRQIFAFDAHSIFTQRFMHVLKPRHGRCVARFNVPNGTRENVNEGVQDTE